MSSYSALYELPIPSTDMGDVRFEDSGASGALWFEYDHDGGPTRRGLQFEKLRAYRKRAEVHCTSREIEGAYDTLVEVPASMWAAEIKRDTPVEWRDYWTLRHFMIFLDSFGCLEVLAADWRTIGQ